VTQAAAASAASRIGAGVPLDPAAFTQAVTRAGDDAALRFGATVSDLMVLGRSAEAASQATDIEYGIVSALLDDNTCPACEEADGFESDNLDEVEALTPNPDCDGGELCRCVPVFMVRTEAA
jgi:hypothetical protein